MTEDPLESERLARVSDLVQHFEQRGDCRHP
jgi:hypothetical protein